jgi:hypothetical protein
MHYFRLAAWMNKYMTMNDDKKQWHKRRRTKKADLCGPGWRTCLYQSSNRLLEPYYMIGLTKAMVILCGWPKI